MSFRGLSLWSFRLSLVCFALAWLLPVFPGELGYLFPGAWAFLASPFVAFGCWATFLLGGFEPRMLLWAVLLTVVTAMNGVFVLAPFLREAFAERPLLVSLSAGISAVSAAILCHFPPGADALLPVWSAVELAWISSFVLMSFSGAAGCLAEAPSSPSTQSVP
ncbi:MAG: hypothetical protein ACKV2Q_16225 [Planctomycetaceae bacterium]